MLFNFYAITAFLVPLFAFSLGFYCFFKKPKSKLTILWFLTSMAVGIWGIGLFILLFVKNTNQAINCNFILYFGATLIPILFFHFVSTFLYHKKTNKWSIAVGYILAAIFVVLVFIPPWIIGGVSAKTGFRYWEDPGILYIPYVIYFWIYVLASIFLLVKAYRKSEGVYKKQIFYFLLAAIIGFIGGGTNFLPQLINIYPFCSFITFLYPILITYGMFLKKY